MRIDKIRKMDDDLERQNVHMMDFRQLHRSCLNWNSEMLAFERSGKPE